MYNIVYMEVNMKIMTMSESRAAYAATLDAVINDQEEVVITRPGGENVVMIPQREYESLRETAYLLSSAANARILTRRIAELRDGVGERHELLEDEAE